MKAATVKKIRKRLGLSRAALASRLGVHYVTVYRWERGLNPVTGPASAMLAVLSGEAPNNA